MLSSLFLGHPALHHLQHLQPIWRMTLSDPLPRLPPWLSHWFGYRSAAPKPIPEYIVYVWSFIGAFCGLAVLRAILGHIPYFIDRGVPSVVVSYGASAVLCYGTIEAPLAGPRRRSLPQRTYGHLHHETVQPSPFTAAIQLFALACWLVIGGHGHRRDADDKNHQPSGRCNRATAGSES